MGTPKRGLCPRLSSAWSTGGSNNGKQSPPEAKV